MLASDWVNQLDPMTVDNLDKLWAHSMGQQLEYCWAH